MDAFLNYYLLSHTIQGSIQIEVAMLELQIEFKLASKKLITTRVGRKEDKMEVMGPITYIHTKERQRHILVCLIGFAFGCWHHDWWLIIRLLLLLFILWVGVLWYELHLIWFNGSINIGSITNNGHIPSHINPTPSHFSFFFPQVRFLSHFVLLIACLPFVPSMAGVKFVSIFFF